MEDKITFTYKNDSGIAISVSVDEDCNLTELMGKFVEFTRLIGYHSASWDNLLKELENEMSYLSEFTIYDWASDVIYYRS